MAFEERATRAGPALTVSDTTVLEAALRRDRLVVVTALLAVILVSWIWIVLGAGTGTSAVAMTQMAGIPDIGHDDGTGGMDAGLRRPYLRKPASPSRGPGRPASHITEQALRSAQDAERDKLDARRGDAGDGKEPMVVVADDPEDRKGALKFVGGSQSDNWNKGSPDDLFKIAR